MFSGLRCEGLEGGPITRSRAQSLSPALPPTSVISEDFQATKWSGSRLHCVGTGITATSRADCPQPGFQGLCIPSHTLGPRSWRVSEVMTEQPLAPAIRERLATWALFYSLCVALSLHLGPQGS